MQDKELVSPKRIKRADQIVESIKRWVAINGKQPGERLPNERELMEQFDCSKGTVREALKSLEVQGLISIRTGPNGGAVLERVPYEKASQLLRNFLHFEQPSGPEIYALRTLIEPEIAALATPNLNDEDLDRLSALVKQCEVPPQTFEERMAQRIAELEFHVVLASRCGNAMLAFIGRFVNDMIRDLVIFKKSALPEQHEFSCANLEYHQRLLEAFYDRDAERARTLMLDHMHSAEHFNRELEGQLHQHFLTPR
ncbi:Transcriptional regulator, GntR family [Marinobacterium lacunae]|uniref:Transcriptional regulator, GntR family n=1 Tax=Marinobacterium lacunae TaxID=1232683 RepID=A0A081G1I8_9GAMM|nr:FCD domain-containing protein [Marinobacterium lacunae]KEA64643.1 Transcriptional regulator, GntR family [Marinobacterium lacunae]MBR9882513.1 FadR family transcriptional regulator [Oceanospirillales bacterium]